MVQNDACLCALFLKIKANNGIDAGIPSGGTPGLDDALIGHQFDVATEDSCAKNGEGSAGLTVDVGRLVGEGRELPGVEKSGIDPGRSGFQIDVLMEGGASGIR